ncbi:MAG: hypothetical protein ACU841_00365 [Gammaproteobacteria bacterium]
MASFMIVPRTKNQSTGLLTGLLVFCLSAAAMAEGNRPFTFAKASVTRIDFSLSDDNLDQFGVTPSASALSGRIIDNLGGWNFPIRRSSEKAFSHRLTAAIGRVSHQSTPVGFSFSAGNSDPRAPEFQKADIIQVSCTLTDIDDPQQSVGETMDFAAGPIVSALKKRRDEAKGIDLLVDHISTVCFNLLDDLEWDDPGKTSDSSIKKPRWMPEIRIETQEQPASDVKPPEARESGNDGRKQIIIHNQGTPVILKLGHDRL